MALLWWCCLASSSANLYFGDNGNSRRRGPGESTVTPDGQTTTADTIEPELANRIVAFEQWAASAGIDLSKVRIVRQYRDLGMEARVSLQQDELVVEVPPNVALRYETALAHPIVGPIVEQHYGNAPAEAQDPVNLPGWYATAILLHHEAFVSRNSQWAPYLRLLPTKFNRYFSFTREELAFLRGGNFFSSFIDRSQDEETQLWITLRDHVFSAYPHIYGNTSDLDVLRQLRLQVRWVHSTLRARAYGPRFPGDHVAIVPVADMLNHNAGAVPVGYRDWDADKVASLTPRGAKSQRLPVYVQRAHAPLGPGQPVWSKYDSSTAPMCAVSFLLSHGFVPEGEENDCFPLTITVPPLSSAETAAQAILIWAMNKYVRLALTYLGTLSPSLASASRDSVAIAGLCYSAATGPSQCGDTGSEHLGNPQGGWLAPGARTAVAALVAFAGKRARVRRVDRIFVSYPVSQCTM